MADGPAAPRRSRPDRARRERPGDRSLVGRWWLPALACTAVAAGVAALLIPGPAAQTTRTGASVAVASSTLGEILVNRDGRALYLYTKDKASRSACSSTCAQVWPPAIVSGRVVAGSGISTARLATTRRGDHGLQLVYNGHPLYTFSGDARRGQTGGEGFLGVWYLVSPAGTPVRTPGAAPGGSPAY